VQFPNRWAEINDRSLRGVSTGKIRNVAGVDFICINGRFFNLAASNLDLRHNHLYLVAGTAFIRIVNDHS